MAADEQHDNGPQDLVTIYLCIQIAIDKMQLCSLSVAYACPYHNPTATMGHSVHNVNPPLLRSVGERFADVNVVNMVPHGARQKLQTMNTIAFYRWQFESTEIPP